MKTDLEIAQEAVMEPIAKVAEKLGTAGIRRRFPMNIWNRFRKNRTES